MVTPPRSVHSDHSQRSPHGGAPVSLTPDRTASGPAVRNAPPHGGDGAAAAPASGADSGVVVAGSGDGPGFGRSQ